MLHVFRYDRWMGYICVMCHVNRDMAVTYNMDHADDCPGLVRPADPVGLPGSDHPSWAAWH